MSKFNQAIADDEFSIGLWPRVGKWAKNSLNDYVKNALGKPGKLIRLIEEGNIEPFAPKRYERSIWFPTAARWELWNRDFDFQPQAIDYWIINKGECRHAKSTLSIKALENLITYELIENNAFDIKEINGLSASKSSDHHFDTISQFAQERCQEFIGSGQPAGLSQNMKWGEIRLHDMSFWDLSWAGQHTPFWMNTGGSHHFAAAHYIASQLGLDYRLEGRLKKYTVNQQAARDLASEWDMFLLDEVSMYTSFLDSMSDFRCDFGVSDVPRQFLKNEVYCPEGSTTQRKVKVVFLRRDETKAAAVAQVLRTAGFSSFNPYIHELADS
ncbi:hypothetical protein BDK62_1242 [Halomonas alkaliantarctica]|nr:hypothetical protein BDK62_1242 [Halomonas alkaliantarctica]